MVVLIVPLELPVVLTLPALVLLVVPPPTVVHTTLQLLVIVLHVVLVRFRFPQFPTCTLHVVVLHDTVV